MVSSKELAIFTGRPAECHVLVGPVNSESLVDGGKEVSDTRLSFEDHRCPLVALPHDLTGLEAAAADSNRPATRPVVAA